METLTVKSISVSKGTSGKGDWTNTQITPTEGRKWTGFLEDLATLKEGDVINITEYKEGKDNRFNKILKYEKVSSASPASVSKPEMTNEMWDEKDRITRASIEAQVAFKGGVELLVGKIILPDGELARSAIDWALARLDDKFKPTSKRWAASEEETKELPGNNETPPPAEGEEWPSLKDVGHLFTRAMKYGLSSRDVCESVGVGRGEDIIDLDEAWATTAKRFASAIKAAQEKADKEGNGG